MMSIMKYVVSKVAVRLLLVAGAIVAVDLILWGSPLASYRMCECIARIVFTGETPARLQCGFANYEISQRIMRWR